MHSDDRDVATTRIDRQDGVTSGVSIHAFAIIGERMNRERRVSATATLRSTALRGVRLAEQQRDAISVENRNRPWPAKHPHGRDGEAHRLRAVSDDPLFVECG